MKTYKLKATETSVFIKEFEIEADSFGEAMLKLETALDQEPLDSMKNTFQGMDREIVDLAPVMVGALHQLRHLDLIADAESDKGMGEISYEGFAETYNTPENWLIQGTDANGNISLYNYDNKADYLNDCTIIGIDPNILTL